MSEKLRNSKITLNGLQRTESTSMMSLFVPLSGPKPSAGHSYPQTALH